MTNWSRLAMTSTIALALATPAFAQSNVPTPTPAPAQASPSTQTTPSEKATSGSLRVGSDGILSVQEEGQFLTSELVGMKVVGVDGKSIGEIDDLVLDEQHQIVGAVLSVGGVLGLGAKEVGVPWSALDVQHSDGETIAMTSLSKEELADMPKFKTQAEVKAEQQRKLTPPATAGGIAAPTVPPKQ